MKKIISITAMVGLFFIQYGFPQEQTVEERVQVVNIEVPVRVTHQGEPVAGLKKEDFQLFENGKLQEIHGFNEFSRKIGVAETVLDAASETTMVYKPRLFVLVFNLTDFHIDMDKGIDFLFEKIVRKNDRLMVLVNNTLVSEHEIMDLALERESLKDLAKNESIKAKQKLQKVVSEFEYQVKEAWDRVFAIQSRPERVAGDSLARELEVLRRLLERVLEYLVYYKQNFLFPDVNKFFAFARYLERRDLEKWVINFYQFELYPKIKFDSRIKMTLNKLITDAMSDVSMRSAYLSAAARGLQKVMTRIDQEMDVGSQFPVEEVSRLFYQVNTTFHTVFMRSLHRNISEDIEYKRIATDIEKSLREITHLTGGELVTSNNLEQTLQTISEKEDIFYILTYAPEDPQAKKRKIKVKLKNKDFDVTYDSLAFPDYFKQLLEKKELDFPDIQVDGFAFKNRLLSFTVANFKMEQAPEGEAGKVEIQVRVKDAQNREVFNQKKALLFKKKSNNISIRFNALKRGKYFIMVDVKDLLTGKSSSQHKEVSINR